MPCHPSVTRIGDWITVSVSLKVVLPPKAGAQVAVVVAITMMTIGFVGLQGNARRAPSVEARGVTGCLVGGVGPNHAGHNSVQGGSGTGKIEVGCPRGIDWRLSRAGDRDERLVRRGHTAPLGQRPVNNGWGARSRKDGLDVPSDGVFCEDGASSCHAKRTNILLLNHRHVLPSASDPKRHMRCRVGDNPLHQQKRVRRRRSQAATPGHPRR